MSKGGKRLDPNQLSFDFDQKIDEYRTLKEEILEGMPGISEAGKPGGDFESYEEACIQEPCRALAEAEDARVISGDEVRQMTMGKLDETILEMQRLKRELRGMR